jgi:hypothetical protein
MSCSPLVWRGLWVVHPNQESQGNKDRRGQKWIGRTKGRRRRKEKKIETKEKEGRTEGRAEGRTEGRTEGR